MITAVQMQSSDADDTGHYCLFSMSPQEMRTAAIARPLEINETDKALRAAIKEVLVCIYSDNSHF